MSPLTIHSTDDTASHLSLNSSTEMKTGEVANNPASGLFAVCAPMSSRTLSPLSPTTQALSRMPTTDARGFVDKLHDTAQCMMDAEKEGQKREAMRLEAENARAIAEKARAIAEQETRETENARAIAEKARATAEQETRETEKARATTEKLKFDRVQLEFQIAQLRVAPPSDVPPICTAAPVVAEPAQKRQRVAKEPSDLSGDRFAAGRRTGFMLARLVLDRIATGPHREGGVSRERTHVNVFRKYVNFPLPHTHHSVVAQQQRPHR